MKIFLVCSLAIIAFSLKETESGAIKHGGSEWVDKPQSGGDTAVEVIATGGSSKDVWTDAPAISQPKPAPVWPSYGGRPLPGFPGSGKPGKVIKPIFPTKIPGIKPLVIIPRPVPNFSQFFPAAAKKEVKPIEKIIKDEKWKEWLLNNPSPVKRPIYPPVYEPPTDLPPNPFGPLETTKKPVRVPYYTEKPVEVTFYAEETTQPPSYTAEPTYRPEPAQPTLVRPNLYQMVQALTLNRFLHLIDEAGLTHYLTGNGPVTIFVPSNEAFERLPLDFIREIASNKESLKKFLLYHIVEGSPQPIGNSYLQLTTVSGHKINVNSHHKIITANGVLVLQPNLGGSNGIFHIINDAFYPVIEKNLRQILEHDDRFTVLVDLLSSAGLLDAHLSDGGPFTFFAPTNAAFEKIDATTLKWLKDNVKNLKELLLSHFTNGIYYTSQLKHGDSLQSLVNKNILAIAKRDEYFYVNQHLISNPDITTTNGVIHAVDGFLYDVKVANLLDTLKSQKYVDSFLNVLEKAGLIDDHLTAGGPFTVFVPLSKTFQNLDSQTLDWLLANPLKLRELILNHFVKGVFYADDLKHGQVLYSVSGTELKVTITDGFKEINGNKLIVTDIAASNGVIHIIDGLLFDIRVQSLLHTLKNQNKFTIFLQLLETAGLLDDHLASGGPFTVFAPSDDQLGKLDEKILKWIQKNPEKLRALLLQHFTSGVYYSKDLTDGLQLQSIQKTTLEFTNKDGYITVNSRPIVEADIQATNGVIHVIDGLLFQVTFQNLLHTLKGQGSRFEIFLEALQNSGLIDEHLTDGGPYTVFVPTDDAFNKIDPVTLKWLLWDPVTLKALVLKHFVKNVYYYDDLTSGSSLTAIGSQAQLVMADGAAGQKTVNGSPISDYDLIATNGVIHSIDDVLFSQDLKKP